MPATTPLFASLGRMRSDHARSTPANYPDYPMSLAQPQQQHDETLFAEKTRKFEDADSSFRALVASLNEYKAAMICLLQCGVKVATNMDSFFAHHDRPHKDVSASFLDTQRAVQAKWLEHAESHFDDDVIAPIQSRIDEIPAVRNYMKHRSDALVEMQKRQKKLHTDRKKDGNRFREKQRVLRDCSDRYAMFHDEVVKRFNYIDRNMGTFVTAPLRSLVTTMADVSNTAVESLSNVVKMISETPPITRDISPIPPISLNDAPGGIIDREIWDDSFKSDNSDDELNDDDCETDSTSAPATSVANSNNINARRPPRVRSADPVAKGTESSTGVESTLTSDVSQIMRPRRGRSASSAPPESLVTLPANLTANSLLSAQREPLGGPSSLSGRACHLGEYFPIVTTPAASSTSTDNNLLDRAASRPPSYAGSTASERRRKRDGKGSIDTVGSAESLGRNEVLMRLIAKYDFTPAEANELELRVGDIIEVNVKSVSGWWCGQCGKSKGYFPENYTRPLSEEEELVFLAEKERRRRRRGHRREESHDSRRSGQTSQSFVPA